MTDRQILEQLRRHSGRDRERPRLPCHRAHSLAEDLGVTVARIGRLCQAHGIKITNCQLGCFGEARRHE